MKRRKPRQKKHPYLIALTVLAVCVFLGCWLKAAFFAESIRFDLGKEDTAKSFTASYSPWLSYSTAGLRLSCPEPCYLLSPSCTSNWEDYPFLKVKLNESNASPIWILWVTNNSKDANGIRIVKPVFSNGSFIAGAKTFQPWNQQMPWQGPIGRVGIRVLSGTVSVSEIVLTDSLTPWEWIRFSIGELRSVEPLLAYSINTVWGASINGISLTVLCGVLTILALLIAWNSRSRMAGKVAIALIAVLVFLVDAPFLISLIRTSAEASARSAWKNSREEEDLSRFGAEYSELVRTLRKEAPAGSTVFIPKGLRYGPSAETDWIVLQIWPQYKPVWSIDKADYILMLHPTQARYDPKSGMVFIPDHDPVRTAPLLFVNSNAALLKRIHD